MLQRVSRGSIDNLLLSLVRSKDLDERKHLVVQILTIPVAWHAGIRYLAARISQTRELACNEDASALLGNRRSYAHALLRLSFLCAGHTNSNAVQVGVSAGNNLEERIMMLMKRSGSISRPALAGLLVAAAVTFGLGEILARAMSLQTSQGQVSAQSFAGTWHWMVRGQPFATMILKPSGDGLSGTVTQSRSAWESCRPRPAGQCRAGRSLTVRGLLRLGPGTWDRKRPRQYLLGGHI